MIAIADKMEIDRNPIVYQADAAERVAEIAAAELGIKPVTQPSTKP